MNGRKLNGRARCELIGNHGFACGDPATFEVVPSGGRGYYACTQHLGKAVRKLLKAGHEHAKVRAHTSA